MKMETNKRLGWQHLLSLDKTDFETETKRRDKDPVISLLSCYPNRPKPPSWGRVRPHVRCVIHLELILYVNCNWKTNFLNITIKKK